MGLFDKKYCDVCGEKIGLLGNRKLEDGNLCKDCAAKLSPFFSGRKNATVEEIKAQLAYREENRQKLASFRPSRTFGDSKKVYIDDGAGTFIVTSRSNWMDANPDLIALNQDPECRSCYQIPVYGNPDAFILVKFLHNGDLALGFFNFSDVAANVTLDFWDIGLSYASGCSLRFYDCLSHRETGIQKEFFAPRVAAHGCKIYRCSIVEN